MGVQAMKHAALLQEWSTKIAECRSRGTTVKAWCAQQGIASTTYYYWEKKFVTEAMEDTANVCAVGPEIIPESVQEYETIRESCQEMHRAAAPV